MAALLRVVCVRGYGSEAPTAPPAGDATLDQLVVHLREHGALAEVDGRADAATVQARVQVALAQRLNPDFNAAAYVAQRLGRVSFLVAPPARRLCVEKCSAGRA